MDLINCVVRVEDCVSKNGNHYSKISVIFPSGVSKVVSFDGSLALEIYREIGVDFLNLGKGGKCA